MSEELTVRELAKQLSFHLRFAGVRGVPEVWFQDAPVDAVSEELKSVASRELIESGPAAVGSTAEAIASLPWEALEQEALGCIRCRLCEGRNKVVFGVGQRERPRIVFVGEGPGADEDKQGEPFVGKAGMLLTSAITKGMGLKRESVFICNVVKCRPPENRTPLPDEVAACSPFLRRQLELLQPEVIVTLGAPAQLALSGMSGGITKIRGRWLEYQGTPLMPTFHPAYILRNPDAKRPFWEDLKEVMKRLSIPEPIKQ